MSPHEPRPRTWEPYDIQVVPVAGVTRSSTSTDELRRQRRALALQDEARRRRADLVPGPDGTWRLTRPGFRPQVLASLDQVQAAIHALQGG
jgi:hypothetical protein